MTEAADEPEAIRRLKARYCRFLGTEDVEFWRANDAKRPRQRRDDASLPHPRDHPDLGHPGLRVMEGLLIGPSCG